jgi:hypothetical protein
MFCLPREAAGVVDKFAPAFTRPTYQRFVTLLVGAIITMGRRTVSHVLWSIPHLIAGHYSSYHRVFSAARWSLWPLAKVLAAAVVALVPADQPVIVDVDDTIAQHTGLRVFGTACYRDAVRSSRRRTNFTWGHKWVVMAINVRLPLCVRPWALPVLMALSTPKPKEKTSDGKKKGTGKKTDGGGAKLRRPEPWRKIKARRKSKDKRRPHKTAVILARQMMATLLHWFPDRRFILLGDWGFASHDLALFCHNHRDRVTLVARTRPHMVLYAQAPTAQRTGSAGRCKRKGRRLPAPAASVKAANNRRRQARVRWYGNRERDVELLGACGGWYRGRGNGTAGLVPVRWVCVRDPPSQREDYFYSTDPTLTPEQIVERFAARWAVEVTFEEAKGQLGFASTRQRCQRSVLRSGPCLMGLFTVVSLIYAELAKAGGGTVTVHGTPCYAKAAPTFTDALAAVRRRLWEQVILLHAPGGAIVTQLPNRVRNWLLEHLAAAA